MQKLANRMCDMRVLNLFPLKQVQRAFRIIFIWKIPISIVLRCNSSYVDAGYVL